MARSTSETKGLQSHSERLQQLIYWVLARSVAPNCPNWSTCLKRVLLTLCTFWVASISYFTNVCIVASCYSYNCICFHSVFMSFIMACSSPDISCTWTYLKVFPCCILHGYFNVRVVSSCYNLFVSNALVTFYYIFVFFMLFQLAFLV